MDRAARSLKILMIAPTSFFADYGCHVRILEEINALSARGHRVTLATYHNGSDLPGIDIRRSVDVPWRKRVIVGSSRHKLYLDAVLSATCLRAGLRLRPDLIHAHLHEGALIGAPLARLLRRPLLFDYQGSLTEEMLDHRFLRPGGLLPAVRRLERQIDRLPDLIVTSSVNAERRLRERGFRGRIQPVLDAVDTSRFTPDALAPEEKLVLRRALGIADSSPVVVYLGLLAPYQGTDLLLEAARAVLEEIPHAQFLVMGFPGVERYQALAQQLDIADRVRFPGRIPYREAQRYLALGDIAVAPKMSLTEGNGKLYNYMAMGLPIVAFDAPANREILGNFAAYAPLGDAAAFARQLTGLLARPALASELGAAVRAEAVRHLSWQARVDDLLAAYATILPAPKRALLTPLGGALSGHSTD
ncbi:MAG TPA: glycosyltransferase family 4 protein [Thermomicrobiaceae bacterium]|nr:glycosyltransferase family 4 protein [Thermomicrobiaceae bacterium]